MKPRFEFGETLLLDGRLNFRGVIGLTSGVLVACLLLFICAPGYVHF
jgi:hypothetical protein